MLQPKNLPHFFQKCLWNRVSLSDFHELIQAAVTKWNLKGADTVDVLLTCFYGFALENDPLVTGYAQVLLNNDYASISDFLRALVLRWNRTTKFKDNEADVYTRKTVRIVRALLSASQAHAPSHSECRKSLILSSRWVCAIARLSNVEHRQFTPEQINMLATSVAYLILSLSGSTAGNIAISRISHVGEDQLKSCLQHVIDATMEAFPPISMQLMTNLQKHSQLFDAVHDSTTDGNVAAMTLEDNVSHPPTVPSRQADYILLYNLLATTSQADDNAISSFMTSRHAGDAMAAVSDMLFAVIGAMTRPNEASDDLYQAQCRLFLYNRLPSVLNLISAYQAIHTEQNLVQVWNHVNTIGRPDLVPILQQFLQICSVYHLISADTFTSLIGEEMSSTPKGLDTKDNLVRKVQDSANRGPRLVEELAKDNGNAVAITLAIAEIMHGYCHSKQTELLKDMANAVVKLPASVNAIGIVMQPSEFLSPFCDLLDNWNWDDIHGESQMVYEEFGSVLLLIMTFKYRLSLSYGELGIVQGSGFVANYISSGHMEKHLSHMTESDEKHLGEWINALYVAGVLADDLTTNCSAQTFHLMVPTLLSQSVAAMSQGKLPEEQLKQGLEYLLEPSLLPALIAAFAWLGQLAVTDIKSATTIAQALAKTPENKEAAEVHRTILGIASSIIQASSSPKDSPQTTELLAAIGDQKPFFIRTTASPVEVETWLGSEGGVRLTLQRAITDLMSMTSEGLYKRQLLDCAIKVHGPETILTDFVTHLVQFSNSSEFHHLLDVLATIVATTKGTSISLCHSLQLMRQRLPIYVKRNNSLFAEALIHLSHRVAHYSNFLVPQPTSLTMDIPNVELYDIDLDVAVVQQSEVQIQPQTNVLQHDPLQGDDIEQMLNDATAMGTVDQLDATLNDADMFDFGTDNYNISNLDDLDLMNF